MSHAGSAAPDPRRAPRLKLPAMYTLVRVTPLDGDQIPRTGHIYDISASGMRFELDDHLADGTPVEVRALLPGKHHTTVHITGHVVRRHDDGTDPGPIRMAMTFNQTAHHDEVHRLGEYLHTSGLAA